MRFGVIAFLIGILLLQQLQALPDRDWLYLVGLLPLLFYFRVLRLPAWLLFGFLWALFFAQQSFESPLASHLVGQDVLLHGVVVSIPEKKPRSVRFLFEPENRQDIPKKIRLNWYGAEDIKVGERWQFMVRLKEPHGFVNPGGFDYEGWLFRHGIQATGYVRKSAQNRYIGDAGYRFQIDRWRSDLAKRIDAVIPNGQFNGMIKALAIGQRDDISDFQWDVLLKTGTNHLMAISGLHVGLIAGMAFFLFRWIWSRCGELSLRWPSPKAGALAAIIAALLYAAMAGFAIPTQRALIMVAVFMLGSRVSE